nr:hypothetical protein [Tanacetum cinerariifolium]
MKSIEKRFGGNKETKKVQNTLLKQQYENFNGTSSESFDQIHDRIQKLISQLEILGKTISQEDINLKFLRILPSEWKTHTLIWRNKSDLEEQSLDDLFNNLKIYEAKVKVNAAPSISAASFKAKVHTLPNVDSLSDAVIYSFFATDEEPTNYALMAYTSSGSSSSSGSDNETSSKNLSKLLESQVSDKTGLGFDSQVFNCQVSDCEELHSYESDNRVPKNPKNDRYKTGEGYHAVPYSYTGTFLPPKPDLDFTDDPKASESVANVFNVESSTNKPSKDMFKAHRPDAPIVEDWISDSEDETEIDFVPKQREPSFVTSTEHVKSSRESV